MTDPLSTTDAPQGDPDEVAPGTDDLAAGRTPAPTADADDASAEAVGTTEADHRSDEGADEGAEERDAADADQEDDAAGGAADEDDAAGGPADEDDSDRLEREGDIAADYLEELLDIADLDGDLDMDVEGDRAAVSIVGADLRQLVGRDGEVLEALQELTRLAVYRETGERSRLMLDIGGFRADKRTRLERIAAQAVEEVRATGERRALDAMTPFERKVVHDAVAAAGLSSSSEGEEPRRHVVVLPA